MASAFFRHPAPPEMVTELLSILAENSHTVHSCVLWDGARDRYGYGIHYVVSDGKRIQLGVHRLAFFLVDPNRELNPILHVSHLCHNKLCINVKHLSYESSSVNNARQTCRMNGECTGHRGFKRCRLDAVNIVELIVHSPRTACHGSYFDPFQVLV